MSDLTGTMFGPWRLARLLGRGGMGHVYEAEHERLGKHAAVKVLLPQHAEKPDVVRRFVNEAKAVNEIGHENIVDVSDFGDHEGVPYMVMELLRGVELRNEIVRCGPMTIERAVGIAVQVASALEAAHRHGIVHRDLKPENVFLVERDGKDDYVKVLDFGVARLADSGGDSTSTGTLLGTPHYMSPEQTETPRVDGRADVYSLGVIVYEMLTGRVPYPGKSAPAVLSAIWRGAPPPLRQARPDVPEWLEAAVMKAFARDPKERWATAAAFRHALLHAGQEEPSFGRAHAIAGVDETAATIRAAPSSENARLAAELAGATRGGAPEATVGAGARAGRGRWWVIVAIVVALVLGGGAVAVWVLLE